MTDVEAIDLRPRAGDDAAAADDPAHERQPARRSRPVWRLLRARLLWFIPTLVIVSLAIFLLVDLAPGDVAVHIGGENATPDQIDAIRRDLGLDDPVVVRYVRWLADAVQGDLGRSPLTRQPVTTVIANALPLTLSIMLVTVVGAVIVATVLGVAAALRPGGFVDRVLSFLIAAGIAVPSFFLCLVVVQQLAVKRGVLPAIGYIPLTENPWEWFKHLLIPAMTLGVHMTGEVASQLRTSLVDVLGRDYILTAYAKGQPQRVVVLKHGLKNAVVPVLTVIGARCALLVGGTVLVERIVVIRGVGYILVDAVINRDVAIVTGLAVVMTMIVLAINLVVDLLYGVFNPKLRSS